jgi:hypothetical protein
MSVSILEGIASKSKKDERGFCLILNRLTESLFFDGVLGNPKIEQIKPWSARGLEKSLRPIRRGAASRARLRIKKRGNKERVTVRTDLTRHGPMAWRICAIMLEFVCDMLDGCDIAIMLLT